MQILFTRHSKSRMYRIPWWNSRQLRKEVELAVAAREERMPIPENVRVRILKGICFFVVKKRHGVIVVLTLGIARRSQKCQ